MEKETQPKEGVLGSLVALREETVVNGRAFMGVCSNNQRTKDALWPIIEENIAKGSAIYSDGLATYRKLHEIGYTHRWAYNVKVKSPISK